MLSVGSLRYLFAIPFIYIIFFFKDLLAVIYPVVSQRKPKGRSSSTVDDYKPQDLFAVVILLIKTLSPPDSPVITEMLLLPHPDRI